MLTPADGDFIAATLGAAAANPLLVADVEAIMATGSCEVADSGALIFAQHDLSCDVFIVKVGTIALSRPRADREPFLQLLRAGDVFGDIGVLLDRPEPVTAIAFEYSEILRIPGDSLIELLGTRPRLARRWLVSIAGRLAAAQDRLEDLLAGPLDHQLASLLLHGSDSHGLMHASQDTIARLLGVQRASVARSLSNLEQRGLIEKRYREIKVVDRDRLAGLVA